MIASNETKHVVVVAITWDTGLNSPTINGYVARSSAWFYSVCPVESIDPMTRSLK